MPNRKRPKTPKTRCGNSMTDQAFWGMIQRVLRRASLRWKPRLLAKNAVRRPYHGKNKRQKFEYQCEHCGNWFAEKQIEMDHVVECASSQCGDDIEGYINRLFCEESGWRVLCKPCHLERHDRERR